VEQRRVGIFCETWESGGIESFLFNVLTHMDRSALELELIAARLEESIFTAPLQQAGVRFHALSGNTRALRENERRFRALLRQRRYDVMHFNLFQGLSLRYVRIAQEEGVAVRIVHSHNTALRKSLTRPVKLALHGLGRRRYTACATDLWACSGEAARFLFDPSVLNRRGFRFIPNGIDTNRFAFDAAVRAGVRQELGLTDCFVVGSAGRLCYQKNQDFLLDAFAALLALRPDSRLLLAGAGEQETLLKEKAARLGIAGAVIFYGVTDRLERLYAAMDVFAFPSLFEGLGIVAVEAQAAGLPTVCSEHIPEEAFVTGLARKVPLTDGADGWAKALSQCVAADRVGSAALVREGGFDIHGVAHLVETEYLRTSHG